MNTVITKGYWIKRKERTLKRRICQKAVNKECKNKKERKKKNLQSSVAIDDWRSKQILVMMQNEYNDICYLEFDDQCRINIFSYWIINMKKTFELLTDDDDDDRPAVTMNRIKKRTSRLIEIHFFSLLSASNYTTKSIFWRYF